MYRQGDVLIVPVTESAVPDQVRAAGPKNRRARESMTLALGESTGHAHALIPTRDEGDFYPAPTEDEPAFAYVPLGGKVVHEEHVSTRQPQHPARTAADVHGPPS